MAECIVQKLGTIHDCKTSGLLLYMKPQPPKRHGLAKMKEGA